MKIKRMTVATALAVAAITAALVGAASSQAGPKPGFPPGTWIGTGVMTVQTEVVADLTIRTTGSARFTLNVSRDHKISGKGTWITTQYGSGPVGSKITGVASVTFSGTPTDVRFSGSQTITTKFVDAAHPEVGATFTKKEYDKRGSLVIKKAGPCLVTGGHTFEGGKFNWKAVLKGTKCP